MSALRAQRQSSHSDNEQVGSPHKSAERRFSGHPFYVVYSNQSPPSVHTASLAPPDIRRRLSSSDHDDIHSPSSESMTPHRRATLQYISLSRKGSKENSADTSCNHRSPSPPQPSMDFVASTACDNPLEKNRGTAMSPESKAATPSASGYAPITAPARLDIKGKEVEASESSKPPLQQESSNPVDEEVEEEEQRRLPLAPNRPPIRLQTSPAPNDTGFIPLPELPQDEQLPKRKPPLHLPPERPKAQSAGQSRDQQPRTRSSRRPTQSVQTARARAQQRRHASSQSPHGRSETTSPRPDFFPGAKRLDEGVPLSTKLLIGAGLLVGVSLIMYFVRSVIRPSSLDFVELHHASTKSVDAPLPTPQMKSVTDAEALEAVLDIRRRIVENMANV